MSVCFDKKEIVNSIDRNLFLEQMKGPRRMKPGLAFGRLKTELIGSFNDVPITRVYKNADFLGRLLNYLNPSVKGGGFPGLDELKNFAKTSDLPSGMSSVAKQLPPDMSSALKSGVPDMSDLANQLPSDALKSVGLPSGISDASGLASNALKSGVPGMSDLANHLPPGMSSVMDKLPPGMPSGIPDFSGIFTMFGLNDPVYIGKVINNAVCIHIMELNSRVYRAFTGKLALDCQTTILNKLLNVTVESLPINELTESKAIAGKNDCIKDEEIQTRINTIVGNEKNIIEEQLGLLVTEMFQQTKSKIQSFANTNVQAIGDGLLGNTDWALPEPNPSSTPDANANAKKEALPKEPKRDAGFADSFPAYVKAALLAANIARGKLLQDQLINNLRFEFLALIGTADIDKWVAKEIRSRIDKEPVTSIQDDILTVKVRKYYKTTHDGKTEEGAESVGGYRKKTRRRRTQKRRRSTRRR